MEEGDRVVLQEALGPCRAGSEGVVAHKDIQGNLAVDITHDPEYNPVTFALSPAPQETYKLGSKCA